MENAAGGAGSMVWMFRRAPDAVVFMIGGCGDGIGAVSVTAAIGGAGLMVWVFSVRLAVVDVFWDRCWGCWGRCCCCGSCVRMDSDHGVDGQRGVCLSCVV